MSDWLRTTRTRRCPICQKPDFCTISADGTVARCQRILTGPSVIKAGEDGAGMYAIHRLDAPADTSGAARPHEASLSPEKASKLARAWHGAIKPDRAKELSEALGLPVDVLGRMRVGWVSAAGLERLETKCRGAGAYTFPMRDAYARIIGIRLRTPDGFKYAVSGSAQGIFIPADLPTDDKRGFLLVEGPTDCAAALALGFSAIGRPSNTACAEVVAEFCARRGVPAVALVEDHDPEGSKAASMTAAGTEHLSRAMMNRGVKLKIIKPGKFKDIREYVNNGGTRQSVEAAIHRATWIRPNQSAACHSHGAGRNNFHEETSSGQRPPGPREGRAA